MLRNQGLQPRHPSDRLDTRHRRGAPRLQVVDDRQRPFPIRVGAALGLIPRGQSEPVLLADERCSAELSFGGTRRLQAARHKPERRRPGLSHLRSVAQIDAHDVIAEHLPAAYQQGRCNRRLAATRESREGHRPSLPHHGAGVQSGSPAQTTHRAEHHAGQNRHDRVDHELSRRVGGLFGQVRPADLGAVRCHQSAEPPVPRIPLGGEELETNRDAGRVGARPDLHAGSPERGLPPDQRARRALRELHLHVRSRSCQRGRQR